MGRKPTASLDTANAQITAISQTILRQLPPGTLTPLPTRSWCYRRALRRSASSSTTPTVSDAYSPQTNIVRQDGRRGVLQSVLKAGTAAVVMTHHATPSLPSRPRFVDLVARDSASPIGEVSHNVVG